MKIKREKFSVALFFLSFLFILSSCSRNEKTSGSADAHLQIMLTDSPFPNAKEVWVDIREIEIIHDGSEQPIILNGTHPGLYNLLNFTDGKDTLLADATIPAGNISQIRLILGDNNYIITTGGEQLALKTPSAQESGLKVQIHQDVSGGILYRLTLDFDAGKSIIKAGNSGQYLLKPVLRILSLQPSGGNIQGIVLPDSVSTVVYAILGTDTIASTFTNGLDGAYLIKDVPAGNYSLVYVPSDTTFLTATGAATVTLGQVTTATTVQLQK